MVLSDNSLYEFQEQNNALRNFKTNLTTQDREHVTLQNVKVNYQLEQIRYLNIFINILFWIFIVLGIIFTIFVFIGSQSASTGIYFKIVMILAVFAFPFIIGYIENYLYNIYQFIRDTILGNTYIRPDY
jgi:hypothetical protein